MSPDLWILGAYGATLGLAGVHGAHRLALLGRFCWPESAESLVAPRRSIAPRVTVQLPLYDERTVAARLIRAAGALEYPRERLEIQVLDDSTDETRAIVDRELALLREQGIDAGVLRRAQRTGFKAGALAAGLAQAKGELLCVFDADFVPPPDFLARLVPHFAAPEVGMVQARWDHLNRAATLFTRAQATLLDGHFVIGHTARCASGLFFNFNGTAGIWRRAAIESAGGWQHDTLTEDLDLSYRAQLAGWRFVYAPLVTAPAELPADLAAFCSQQRRWARGSVQVLRKLGRRLASERIRRAVRADALLHLSINAGYPCVLAIAVLLPLTLRSRVHFSHWLHFFLFVLCTVSALAYYERAQRALGRPLAARLIDVLSAVALGIGISLRQTRAVLAGLRPRTGEFVRTPKAGGTPRARHYRPAGTRLPLAELFLAAWSASGFAHALRHGLWGALPFLALFAAGFAWVAALSIPAWARGSSAR